VYNRFLHERTAAYKDGHPMNYVTSSRELTQLKRDPDYAWLNDVASVPLQQSLRQLQTAFKNFFNKRTGYPKFKKKQGTQSAEYTRSGFRFETGNQRLLIAKIGRLKVKWSRVVPIEPTTVNIIRKPSGKYFVSMVVDITPALLPEIGKCVGIDFGIRRLATTSDGEYIGNPKYSRKYARKLAKAQKAFARTQKGSNRRKRTAQKIAKIHEKITNCRSDHQNKFAWQMFNKYDIVFVEDLNVRGMLKNHKLAFSVSDTSISQYIRTLEQKAAMHGKQIVKIDRWFPSTKMCSQCATIHDMSLGKEWMICNCGNMMDRDYNAALNILAVGQTESLNVRGDDVRAAQSLRLESRLSVKRKPS